ncbi:hypothetical protein [Tenacibaculum finnmarkense]|uniref:hypothetical protein n=1 Tax=Tenacibaculum finnmarkense TaxID=2781243 RepID=UPI001EFBB334|nr:hypothetical protein [Tenacibaculum finnmarkense]MCG8734007.1 hypothetical protein [Tenacibaculum finnmarkense]
MQIEKWLKDGCNYSEGVLLYISKKGHNTNLARLFTRKESVYNLEKLKHELRKFTDTEIETIAVPEKKIPQIINKKPPEKHKTTRGFYRLNQLAIELHPLSIKQRNDFQKAISLKLKLNSLHASEEGIALTLCLEIEHLFDAIDTTQRVLDHYVSHKVILNITPRNYTDLNAAQLLQARNNKRVAVSRYQTKVANLTIDVSKKQTIAVATKKKISLGKAKSKLLEHQLDLQVLNELINQPKNS